jgi:hypothetical protein
MSMILKIPGSKVLKTLAKLHPGLHQFPKTTWFNRYPELFAATAVLLPAAIRILSFGCSTGEECVTLADYFPAAMIIGTDINPLNLWKARKFRNERIRFVYAIDRLLKRLGPFDAVFCMAVLRTPRRNHVSEHYPFERFEERVLFLDSLVRPGGVLVVHNSSYRFSDTTSSSHYEKVPVIAPNDDIYQPDGLTKATPDGSIFRKLKSDLPARVLEVASAAHLRSA